MSTQTNGKESAALYVLARMVADPRLAWLIGPGSTAYEQLTAEAAAQRGQTPEEFQATHEPLLKFEPWCGPADATSDDRLARLGAHVEKFASNIGWQREDGEGALEYIQRKSYRQGWEDGKQEGSGDIHRDGTAGVAPASTTGELLREAMPWLEMHRDDEARDLGGRIRAALASGVREVSQACREVGCAVLARERTAGVLAVDEPQQKGGA